jgi:hypothetical protein
MPPSALPRAGALALCTALAPPASAEPLAQEPERPAAIAGPRAELEIACPPPCGEPPRPRTLAVRRPGWRRSAPTVFFETVGLRGGVTRVRGSDADTLANGATLAVDVLVYDARGWENLRYRHFASIGGGGAGFEGSLGLDLAWGVRVPVGPHHGPVARLGARGFMLGNQRLYHALLELPLGQIGYQYLSRRLHLELAGRAGPVLVGRYNVGDEASRKLGSAFEWGGHAAIAWEPVRLELSAMRVEASRSGPGTPLDVLGARLCGVAAHLGVCADADFYTGDTVIASAPVEREARVDSVFAGITIGYVPRFE